IAPCTLADTDDADSLDFESFLSDGNDKSRRHDVGKSAQGEILAGGLDNDVYRVSASYDASDSLDVLQALAGLYQQMDTRCVDGWVKGVEWAEIKGEERFLNVEF
ncbi:MAG: hypothetical protein QMB64_04865, partial [Pseudomonadales bacterium]